AAQFARLNRMDHLKERETSQDELTWRRTRPRLARHKAPGRHESVCKNVSNSPKKQRKKLIALIVPPTPFRGEENTDKVVLRIPAEWKRMTALDLRVKPSVTRTEGLHQEIQIENLHKLRPRCFWV